MRNIGLKAFYDGEEVNRVAVPTDMYKHSGLDSIGRMSQDSKLHTGETVNRSIEINYTGPSVLQYRVTYCITYCITSE
ncbi:MAG: hypothetical protein ACE5KE_12845 [Methanosarcinales archaeon]